MRKHRLKKIYNRKNAFFIFITKRNFLEILNTDSDRLVYFALEIISEFLLDRFHRKTSVQDLMIK